MEEANCNWTTCVWRPGRFLISLTVREVLTERLQYRSTDLVVPGAGKLQLVYTPTDGKEPTVLDVYNFKGKGVAMSLYNTDEVCFSLPRSLSRCLTNSHHSLFLGLLIPPSKWHWRRKCPWYVPHVKAHADERLRIIAIQFLSTKNTIMKKYDGRFKDIFQEIYEQ